MACNRACFWVLVAMALFIGDGAHAKRALQWYPAPAPAPAPVCPSPATVDVSLDAYSGAWYEIASTALFKSREESDLVCIMAFYSVIPSGALAGAVRVFNEGYNTSSGVFSSIVGSATVVSPGRLAVSFPGFPPGDYRIIYVTGSAEERYKTAVVYSCAEDGGYQSLYILSRKPVLDRDDSVAEILAVAAGQGIVLEPNNQLVLTTQDPITCGRNIQ